ncbi:hypothetical protein E4U53_000058 [Claviceps sorghi]|nr:hypothetical protein E4U53_000058 [Claviceps sorghi]
MRSTTHHLSVLLLAGCAAAMSPSECLSTHGDALVVSTSCSDAQTVRRCLADGAADLDKAGLDASLSLFDQADVQACFVEAGCSVSQADEHTQRLIRRCRDMAAQAQAPELKKRQHIDQRAAAPMATPFDAGHAARAALRDRDALAPAPAPTPAPASNHKSGADCFSFGTTSTLSCLHETVSGHLISQACMPVRATTSACLRGYICTTDANQQDVCMQAQNALGTDGVIIAVVFSFFIFLGLGYFLFAFLQHRKRQKRIAAKAEALAVARAAAMTQHSQDVKVPLMQQAHDGGPDLAQDAFHDRA